MKDAIETIATQQTGDEQSFTNRKLIRPALPRIDHNHGNHNSNHNANHAQSTERRDRHDRSERTFERSDRAERSAPPSSGGRKPAPPEQTNAENFYYQKQMQSRTAMVIVLQDGEEIRGIIEWYDKTCIKVIRENGRPNLMIYKPAIKYMFKEDEGRH